MTINHLNLPVADVAACAGFFETFFGFTRRPSRDPALLTVLDNAERFVLVLMAESMNRSGNSAYPDAFHLGFMQPDAAAVDAMHRRLTEGGIDVGRAPGKIRDSYGFYFHFDRLFLEIGCYST